MAAAAPPPPAAVSAPPAAAEAAPAQRFSLGAALLGGVPDATSAQPQEQAPPDLQALLVRKHADAAALWGLFRSCRGGRDLVLEQARQAALELPLLLDQSDEQRVAQHCQIKSALSTRGRLPTRLHLDGWDERRDPTVSDTPMPIEHLQSILNPSTAAGITEAVIRCNCWQHPQPSAVTQLLAALPSLTRLEMAFARDIALPPTSQLPQLRELSLSPASIEAGMHMMRWVARYMAQLSSLHYDGLNLLPASSALFRAGVHAPHLTTLSLPQWDLTDELLRLILDRAPAVEQLRVHQISLATAAYRQREWVVACLTVCPAGHKGMAYLPRCKAGRVCWQVKGETYLELACVGEQGLNPDLVTRLPEWQFDTTRLRVCPATGLPASVQPVALRNTLTQLNTHLASQTPIIELSDWHITVQFVNAVARALPQESGLALGIHMGGYLTAADMSQLKYMGPRMHSAAAETHTTGNVVRWSWASLFLGQTSTAGLACLLGMPLPADGGLRTVYVDTLTVDVLSKEDASNSSRQLTTVQWAPLSGRKVHITLCGSHCLLFLPSLSLLRGLRFTEGTEVCITFQKVFMTDQVMAALQGLPELSGSLAFEKCTWPLPAPGYARLAQYVPTSYASWHVQCEQAVLDSICVGINEARARLGARPLPVYAHIDKVRRVGEHVVLKHAPGP